jgi:hypothetical protein
MGYGSGYCFSTKWKFTDMESVLEPPCHSIFRQPAYTFSPQQLDCHVFSSWIHDETSTWQPEDRLVLSNRGWSDKAIAFALNLRACKMQPTSNFWAFRGILQGDEVCKTNLKASIAVPWILVSLIYVTWHSRIPWFMKICITCVHVFWFILDDKYQKHA